jgi:hypothetical protein
MPVTGCCEVGLPDDLGRDDAVVAEVIGRSSGGCGEVPEEADPSREFCRLSDKRSRVVGLTVLCEVEAPLTHERADGEDEDETVIAASKNRGSFA